MVSLHAFYLAAVLAGSGETVLLDFTASWCGHCQTMRPTIHRLRDAGFPVREVDVDREPELARRFAVRPIPCFVLVVDGREVDRVVGAASFDRLAEMFRKAGWRPPSDGFRGQSPDHGYGAPIQVAPADYGRPIAAPSMASEFPVATKTGAPDRPDPTPNNHRSPYSPEQLAYQATVHLKVVDATGQSHGTGTIVDVHGGEALIVTCGHLFRESRGNCEISVELFAPGATAPVPGYLLFYEAEKRDIGLVSVRPGIPITPVPVASNNNLPQKDDPVFSIGCNHGASPTVQKSRITSINRYLGPANLETLGHPVIGRSGGGLFTADGHLVGVCNAADMEEDRGIYASLPIIHDALTSIGQNHVFQERATNAPPILAQQQPASPSPGLPPSSPETRAPARPRAFEDEYEIICFVRSRDGSGEDEVFFLDHPTTDLLQRLALESRQTSDTSRLASLPARPRDRRPPTAPPVVRAQDR